jgi:hypothetical protein
LQVIDPNPTDQKLRGIEDINGEILLLLIKAREREKGVMSENSLCF